ncbi:Glycogen phosphorylase [Caloramator mitchellensis]|uniref:Alpha-1,4 glucan phosphorylase n=1 Tax=Caloramator mitchellensis TaxID=908809 RepID=A0A0R3JUZ2_CALMK|nr:glycogen/starch/alpha-glucan phosphorylase [Caloramator mitchellensis]KRQ87379.1 Glycogen phosphorylase [Caloramator mitchellensis]
MQLDKERIKSDFERKLISLFAEDIKDASRLHKYVALGEIIKEYTFENWLKSNKKYIKGDVKQIYYFSMEFLIGRLLENNLINLGIRDLVAEALDDLGLSLEELEMEERDAGLGNGGLGRLAACFLDSMASLGISGHGNGIRYKYGLFEQKIVNGYQVEVPDNWLKDGYVWEVRRADRAVIVNFGGNVRFDIVDGRLKAIHENYESVLAVPYDVPVVGYGNNVVNTLRLWSAEPVGSEFDFSSFSMGDYARAMEYKYSVESITSVLYPDDRTEKGRMLRLKQEYFFVSAGVQSIVRTYKKKGKPIKHFAKYCAIHINDTHPALAIPELMRILIDEENLTWEEAWDITVNTMAYTNHTIMAEALEKWSVDMFKSLLPRIWTIVEEINRRFCQELVEKYKDDWKRIDEMLIIKDGFVKMANLAIVGSHSVNGVAKLHTKILKEQELKLFNEYYTGKFNNKTNGITHRRWLLDSNPKLARLLNETIGDGWIKNPNQLIEFKKFAKDKSIQQKFEAVKQSNKIELSRFIKNRYGINVDPDSIFDIQAKRLHGYKRQLLNALHILDLYNRLKENRNLDIYPRTFIFSAKAFPGYVLAKEIIKFINTLANKINNDEDIDDKIKVVFLENYGVSLAEKIIPCANVSEQISTASKEASGTGNMKFMMNGAITIGTLDGANVEIKEAVGDENIVIFGMTADEVIELYKNGSYKSLELYYSDERIKRVIDQLMNGYLDVPGSEFMNIYNHLITNNDEFFVLKDFYAYADAQMKIDNLFRDKSKWNEMAIINVASSGIFSSDNTIKRYAEDIWGIDV